METNRVTKMAVSLSRTVSETSGSLVSDSSNPTPPECLADLDDEAIKQLTNQLESVNQLQIQEVELFEKYIKRLDPKDATKTVPASTVHVERATGQKKKSKQRAGASTERMMKLTLEQKCVIAAREIDDVREEMEGKEVERERQLDHQKAMIAEYGHEMVEINKATYEFERDILRGAVNSRTGKMMAERVTKFYEDYLKSRDGLMEKLRLKNSTMRVKKQKLITQLKQKEESGEVRHEVDFDQLKIENKQLHEKVEEKNRELLQLKLTSGKITQVLNTYKQKVGTFTGESASLSEEIQSRRDMLEKIDAETEAVTKERQRAEEINTHAKRQIEDFSVPEVMEYVQLKASQHEILKRLHIMERKVEIAEMTLRSYHQMWGQLRKQIMSQQTIKQKMFA